MKDGGDYPLMSKIIHLVSSILAQSNDENKEIAMSMMRMH
jgi:hypothetical protein